MIKKSAKSLTIKIFKKIMLLRTFLLNRYNESLKDDKFAVDATYSQETRASETEGI